MPSTAKIGRQIDHDRRIIQSAYGTPEGKALIDRLTDIYGWPSVRDNELKTFVELGSFQVVQWLQMKLAEETEYDRPLETPK